MSAILKKISFFIITAMATLIIGGCGNTTAVTSQTEQKSIKPQLELLSEKPMGAVAEDKIPDVTADRWTFEVQSTKPIVTPDGKNVLVVGTDKMSWIETGTGKEIWSKATYGGIGGYLVDNDQIYLSEKFGNKKDKEHGYIICLDSKSGNELWKFDVQSDLSILVNKTKPKDIVPDTTCSIKFVLEGDKMYVVGGTTWLVKKDKFKSEVLLCLDRKGKQLWKKESDTLPGLISMSSIRVIDNKLVMGNYSYGDDVNGPACAQAFNINNGELVWKFQIPNDPEMANSKATNVAVEVVGDKVVAAANFGKVFVLDSNGKLIKEFKAFKPEKSQDYTLYTSVYNTTLAAGKDEIIIAPGSTVVKGASNVKVDIEHPDSNSIMVFSLQGDLKWKFRLGGKVTSILVKDKYLLLGTMHNENTLDYSYCGVYAFDLTQKEAKGEINASDKSVLSKYIGFYKTDGAILSENMGASNDGKVICVTTWPTRTKTEKHGQNSLVTLKIN